MGSDDLGFSDSSEFPIADAIAISAAYPGVIGPYRFKAGKQDVFLSDGGLFDNLGLDAVFDLEAEEIRRDLDADFLLVSDASKGITHKRLAPVWRPLLRTLRLIDVINQQVRSLRLRTLLPFFENKPQQGMYIAIGKNHTDDSNLSKELAEYSFLSAKNVEQATNTRTSLASLSEQQFENLVRHGYESALVQYSVLTSQQ
jgi:NTE family protein